MIVSGTLDDVPHYDTNTEINISRYTCHKMCHKTKRDHEMFTCSVRKNAYGIGFRARWGISALVSESSPRLSGSGWIQTLVLI